MKIIDLRAIQIIPGGIDASEGSVTALFVAVEPRERRLLGLMLSVAEQAQSLPQEVRMCCGGRCRMWIVVITGIAATSKC